LLLKGRAEVVLAHINQLIRGECNLFDYQIFVVPGVSATATILPAVASWPTN